MGAAAAFAPLAAAVAGPLVSNFFAPKPPKPQAAPTQANVARAQEPPRTPTLADANVERARRATSQKNIRKDTLRSAPQGLLDDGPTTASLL